MKTPVKKRRASTPRSQAAVDAQSKRGIRVGASLKKIWAWIKGLDRVLTVVFGGATLSTILGAVIAPVREFLLSPLHISGTQVVRYGWMFVVMVLGAVGSVILLPWLVCARGRLRKRGAELESLQGENRELTATLESLRVPEWIQFHFLDFDWRLSPQILSNYEQQLSDIHGGTLRNWIKGPICPECHKDAEVQIRNVADKCFCGRSFPEFVGRGYSSDVITAMKNDVYLEAQARLRKNGTLEAGSAASP